MPRAPRQATAPSKVEANVRIAHLPTPEQIAAKVRRQPIAVIADICRDLGIMPSHPLWRELQVVIIGEGGSLANLIKDILEQAFPTARTPPPGSPTPPLRSLHPSAPGRPEICPALDEIRIVMAGEDWASVFPARAAQSAHGLFVWSAAVPEAIREAVSVIIRTHDGTR